MKDFFLKLKESFKIGDKKALWLSVGLFLILGIFLSWGYSSYLRSYYGSFSGNYEKIVTPAVKEKEKKAPPKVVPRALDGVMVKRELANIQPVGVMIENLSSVRPQASLSKASVVYEALVEGLTTRFLLIYDQKELPEKIGPVRSARPYYLEWLSEYDALYVHAGGSPEALQAISGFSLKDLNALYQGPYFWRDTTKAAPHNLYTSEELLTRALSNFGFLDDSPDFETWKFKDDFPKNERTSEEKFVKVKFSGYSTEAEYRYDREQNNYLRFNSGVPHNDSNTNEQIRAKNVIIVVIPPIVSFGEKGRLTLDVHGEGKAILALDGTVIEGIWKKAGREDRTKFYDSNGKEIKLNRGATWIHILPETMGFEYN